MTLTSGARLGPYEVQSPIGAGGMGEVYRARDTRLDRAVAIKLLPASFADRPERRQRFRQEARAISSLQHPHICTLFDVGEQDGQVFLVLEYLEGETLDDRLIRGPLPSADLLLYATQIASALDHAHRAQIVHRDLKPSNVMLTESGAKLLDFGLAMGPALAPLGTSTTVSFPQQKLTAEGLLIGTFQYMAPEQLEGKQADARTDIFALGAVLYEMATGRKAFEGDSQASLIASILTGHPPAITSARTAIDTDNSLVALEHVVERCLAKNPDERWQTMRDVKLELDWIGKGRTSTRAPTSTLRRFRPREAAAWAVALVAVLAAAAAAIMPFRTTAVEATRFVVSMPEGTTMWVAESRTQMAISPDGRRLAMVVSRGGRQQIWIRSLDSVTAEPLAFTDGAISPFWSPDSRFVGFFSPGDGALKKVEVTGGPARTICTARADGVPTWGSDGTILFTQFLDGIYRVSADGGTPTRVTQIDKSKRELNHYWPQFLPGGRNFLYMATALEPTGLRSTPTVYVASFDSPKPTLLTRLHSRMTYAEPGYLLFAEDGALMAQRFDTTRLQLVGEPTRVADGVFHLRTIGNSSFAVSANGVLAYQGAGHQARVVWSDRRGNMTDTGWAIQDYGTLAFSPDGQRVAVDVSNPRTGTGDIWISDVSRGAPVRLTSEPDDESRPVWSPDGSRLVYRSNRGGPESLRIGSAAPNLFLRVLSTGSEELLVPDPNPLHPEDWSLDNRWIAYTRNTQQTGADIWLVPLAQGGKPFPFSSERFIERDARFSPDSRWIAFVSTEAGQPEVYVAPVGEAGARKRISVDGGTTPRWGQNGELFYAAADNRTIMQVPIQSGATFAAGAPTRLFSIGASSAAPSLFSGIVYDVSPDGRFLISVPDGQPPASQITVVLNWTAALNN